MFKTPMSNHGRVLIICLFLISCTSQPVKEKKYGPATTQLMEILENDPEAKSMLISSIEKAHQINPDPMTNPAHSLEEFYDFVSYSETAMPWALVKKPDYPEIFNNIFQSICAFYFLLDQPIAELEDRGLYNNTLQYADPIASWLNTFSQSWGTYLDTEESWNEEYLEMAQNDPAFGLQNGWYEDPSNWSTFNQFFSRYLRSPDERPIAEPENNSVVTSFADSEPQGVWAIDSASNIIDDSGVAVKSATLRYIPALIGEGSQYKDAFANGTFTHSFLNVNDYHRYHFPLSGTVKEVRIIQGINPTGGTLSWDQENNRYSFDPSAIGWQTVETRGCVILETDEYGLVGLIPIGMVVVGSVNFEDNLSPGTEVKKGDMLGHFAFGGSDFIMLFQEKVNFNLDVPKKEGSSYYEHLLMGERMGFLELK